MKQKEFKFRVYKSDDSFYEETVARDNLTDAQLRLLVGSLTKDYNDLPLEGRNMFLGILNEKVDEMHTIQEGDMVSVIEGDRKSIQMYRVFGVFRKDDLFLVSVENMSTHAREQIPYLNLRLEYKFMKR